MTASAVVLCGCGGSASDGDDAATPTSDGDAALPNSVDGATRRSGDAPVNAGSQSASAGTADAAAPLGCTGAWLDDDNWDTCPELLGAGPNCGCNGYAPDAGTLASDDPASIFDVTSFLLPLPMMAGKPYAFSFAVTDNGFYGDIELWGTNGTCGPGLERLYAAPIASKGYCINVVAAQNYPYVLLVERLAVDGGALASLSASRFMACPTDRCVSP
jgi:hypothetical protein